MCSGQGAAFSLDGSASTNSTVVVVTYFVQLTTVRHKYPQDSNLLSEVDAYRSVNKSEPERCTYFEVRAGPSWQGRRSTGSRTAELTRILEKGLLQQPNIHSTQQTHDFRLRPAFLSTMRWPYAHDSTTILLGGSGRYTTGWLSYVLRTVEDKHFMTEVRNK